MASDNDLTKVENLLNTDPEPDLNIGKIDGRDISPIANKAIQNSPSRKPKIMQSAKALRKENSQSHSPPALPRKP
jgi:acetylglutamate kinase